MPQNDVTAKMDLLWKFLKPISFALIGKEVDFAKLDGTVVAYGTIILIVGCAVCSAELFCHAVSHDFITTWTTFFLILLALRLHMPPVLIEHCQSRLLFAYVSAFGGDLNWKERAYVTLSGFPKATVQVRYPIGIEALYLDLQNI